MQYVCGELRDFLYCTRDHVSSNKVSNMENTAPSLDVSRKRKANVRDPHSDIGTKKKRPAKPHCALCKLAKRSVSNTLEQATSGQSNFGDLVAAVLQEVDTQLYIHTFPCRTEFWEHFKLTDLTTKICKDLGELYCTTYSLCDSGKDKYARFQLEWYKKCSFLLLEDPAEPSHPLYTVGRQWNSYRANHADRCSIYHSSAVLIAVQSATLSGHNLRDSLLSTRTHENTEHKKHNLVILLQ